MLVSIIDAKCKAAGHTLTKVDPKIIQASDYDHTNQKYVKGEHRTLWITLSNGDKIQRNLYCAFLLFCVEDGKIQQSQCDLYYPKFKILHDAEMTAKLEKK